MKRPKVWETWRRKLQSLLPKKLFKKKVRKDEACLSKIEACERIPSPVKWEKGKYKMSMGSSSQTPMAPRKNKRKEKNPKPIVESLKHIDFHFSSESNGDVHSLFIPLNGMRKGKGGKQTLECLVVDKSFEKWEEVPKIVQGVSIFCGCLPCVCGPIRGNHSTKLGNSQVDKSHCGRFGCH